MEGRIWGDTPDELDPVKKGEKRGNGESRKDPAQTPSFISKVEKVAEGDVPRVSAGRRKKGSTADREKDKTKKR